MGVPMAVAYLGMGAAAVGGIAGAVKVGVHLIRKAKKEPGAAARAGVGTYVRELIGDWVDGFEGYGDSGHGHHGDDSHGGYHSDSDSCGSDGGSD